MPILPADSKLAELMLFVSDRSADDERFGATKLNKILFYADFAAYLFLGAPITGQEYQRLGNGPAPRRLVPVRDLLVANQELAIQRVQYYGRPQERTIALRSARLAEFTADEIALVTKIIEENWTRNARQISLKSHKFHGWEDAQDGEGIPYEVALLAKRKPSKFDKAKLRASAALAAEVIAGKVEVVPLDA